MRGTGISSGLRGTNARGNALARGKQLRDHPPDRNHVTGLRLATETSVGGRFDFDDGFVRLDLEENFTLGDRFTCFFRQEISFPVSWAILSAGITTLMAIFG